MFDLTNRIAKPKKGAMPGYSGTNFWRRHRKLWFLFLIGFSVIYGFAFAIFGTFFLLQLTVPLISLAALVIWLLPVTENAPTELLQKLLLAFICALLAWPDYLAVALPGLPWITAIRLVAVPLALTMLLCLSLSDNFRSQMKDIIGASPGVWKLLVAFIGLSALSIVVSTDRGVSINKFIVAQLYWTMIFFAAAYTFSRPGKMTIFSFILFFFVIYICTIGLQEWRLQRLPWAGNVPNFLKVEDEAVARILSAKSRAATGIYRVQSKFTTPLGLAEFLGLATPFILHFLMTHRSLLVKFVAAVSLPVMFYVIILTDSRLGVVGFFLSFMFYLAAWGILRWRHAERSLFGPAITLAYPILFSLFMASTFFVGRIRALVWGTKAQSFSTQAREDQIAAGVPMIFQNPWGFGIGQGAEALGYTNLAGILTIDSHFLLVGLEFGVIGFLVYYSIFLAQIVYNGLGLLKEQRGEVAFLVPLSIAMANFVIIKSIFAQQENHALVFAMLGASTALVYRAKMQREGKMEAESS